MPNKTQNKNKIPIMYNNAYLQVCFEAGFRARNEKTNLKFFAPEFFKHIITTNAWQYGYNQAILHKVEPLFRGA